MARSYLFIPGNVPRMLQNMDVFDADAVIVDFEDAVATSDKDEARHLTSKFLQKHFPETCEIYVRVNAEQPWLEADIIAIKDLPLNGVVLPKTDVETLSLATELFDKHATAFDIIGIIETPRAFFHLETIFAHPSFKGAILGGEDLRKHIGFKPNDIALAFPRTQLLYAAASFNKIVVDTPYTGMDNAALEADIENASALGYKAKCAIHPNHVPTINAAFLPSTTAIKTAMRIVKQHENTGSMRFSLDGKMIDKPVILEAKDTLKRARKYGMEIRDSDET